MVIFGEKLITIPEQKWFFKNFLKKPIFLVHFGSFRLRSMNTLNAQEKQNQIILSINLKKYVACAIYQ